MKARFVVNPALKGTSGVESVHTEMLLLCTVAGTELGPTARTVDESLNGLISRKLGKQGYNGEVGQMLSFAAPKKATVKRINIAGLGEVSDRLPRNLCKAISLTVKDALNRDLTRLSIPVMPNSMSQIKLKGQAKIIREVVEAALASEEYRDREGTFEVELICSKQAARFLEEGLAIAPNLDSVCCLDEDDDTE
jgi:hypothetical protein